ncbi:MAG TPA: hypothetical protein VF607_14535, partial [Verrucomicrobiae bacterium]
MIKYTPKPIQPRRPGHYPWRSVLAGTAFLAAPWLAQAVGPAVQLVWTSQPGSAHIGSPFGQQPTLVTADANGQPSTIGLAASVSVTVDTVPTGLLNGGPRTIDLGTAAANGSYTFSGLEIDTAGGYALTALAGNGTNAVVSPTNGLPTCQLWLDASDLNTLSVTANSSLTNWLDKSGTGNNAVGITAGSTANAPFMGTNADLSAFAFGGRHVVSFYGT